VGEALQRSHGWRFWFPSPDAPDDECPTYAQRGEAIRCAECSKLIMRRETPHIPAELCYRCHLARQR
jgi:hypothetical protein